MPFVDIHCPYCGEPVEIFIDESAGPQRYIEDCQVCCRPIDIAVSVGKDGEAEVRASAENDA